MDSGNSAAMDLEGQKCYYSGGHPAQIIASTRLVQNGINTSLDTLDIYELFFIDGMRRAHRWVSVSLHLVNIHASISSRVMQFFLQ